jgi:hypothetical protein
MRSLYGHLAVACVLRALVVDGAAQMAPIPTARGLVQQYDRNRHGKLDREEFQQAVVEAFFFRDKDPDGHLTVIELDSAAPEAVKAAGGKGDSRLTLREYKRPSNALLPLGPRRSPSPPTASSGTSCSGKRGAPPTPQSIASWRASAACSAWRPVWGAWSGCPRWRF